MDKIAMFGGVHACLRVLRRVQTCLSIPKPVRKVSLALGKTSIRMGQIGDLATGPGSFYPCLFQKVIQCFFDSWSSHMVLPAALVMLTGLGAEMAMFDGWAISNPSRVPSQCWTDTYVLYASEMDKDPERAK